MKKVCQIIIVRCQIGQIGIGILLGEAMVDLQSLSKQFFCFLEGAIVEKRECQIVAAHCQSRQIDIGTLLGEVTVNL